ncbi:MAG: LPP20 family lipoprotein [Nitrospirae bacterium]|nr:LPP20 family lipoprotein [Nitrospirota bacterium]
MGCLWLVGTSSVSCAWLGGKGKPGWVDGASLEYPSAQYLIGVGQADNRANASDQAYAAVARIFKAEVAAQAKDWESYLVVENRGSSNTERRLTLDNVTKVSTDKVLENVRIMDAWYDSHKGLHYVLAVMNRPQAEASLMERMSALDRTVEEDVTESRQTTDKLAKIRNLRRAARNLVLREAYNADLRVIRPSGQGTAAVYRVNELSNELEQFLATNLVVAVQVSGDHAEPIQRALMEGLIREGLHVTTKTASGEGMSPELLVRGTVRLFPIEVHDPQFKYVRWCSDFDVVEMAAQRVVGAVARGGKEGHLTEREATAKTLRVIQQEFSSDVAKAIAAHIYGEAALPASAAMPAGCPREESSARPAR